MCASREHAPIEEASTTLFTGGVVPAVDSRSNSLTLLVCTCESGVTTSARLQRGSGYIVLAHPGWRTSRHVMKKATVIRRHCLSLAAATSDGCLLSVTCRDVRHPGYTIKGHARDGYDSIRAHLMIHRQLKQSTGCNCILISRVLTFGRLLQLSMGRPHNASPQQQHSGNDGGTKVGFCLGS